MVSEPRARVANAPHTPPTTRPTPVSFIALDMIQTDYGRYKAVIHLSVTLADLLSLTQQWQVTGQL